MSLRVVRTLDEAIDGWEDGSPSAFGPEHAHALIAAARSWRAALKGDVAVIPGSEVVEVEKRSGYTHVTPNSITDLEPGRYVLLRCSIGGEGETQ